ncbi:hypothetical protein H7H37_12975 [Mycolicibacterium insubricum]|nr:hypothetical protein [Mycolicibacterium insubricum]
MADPQHEESPGDERDDDAAPVTATDDGAIDKTPPRDGPPTACWRSRWGWQWRRW